MVMKRFATWLALGLFAISTPAWAQAFGEEEETPPPEPTPAPEPDDTSVAPAPAPVMAPSAAPAGEVSRPTAKSFAVGFGWVWPGQDIDIPNTVSARFILSPGLTIEPSVTLALTGGNSELDGDNVEERSGFDFLVGGLARLTAGSRYKVDFQLLASVELGYSSETVNPAGSDNTDEQSALGFAAGWGLGVVYFPKPHWSLSLDAMNPLLIYTTTALNPPGDNNTLTSSDYLFGAIWDPNARVMFHVYF